MTGSEKQVAWASEIKDSALAAARKLRAEIAATTAKLNLGNYPLASFDTEIARMVAVMDACPQAGWFIDHRRELTIDSFAKFDSLMHTVARIERDLKQGGSKYTWA
jgi:hypothetical protein